MTTELWNKATDGRHKICVVSINKIYDIVAKLCPVWAAYDVKISDPASAFVPPLHVSKLRDDMPKLKRQIIQTANAGIATSAPEAKVARFKEMRGCVLPFTDTCLCIASYAHGIFRVRRKVLNQAQPD